MCLLFFLEESIHEVSRQYLIPEYHSCKISVSKIYKKGNNSKISYTFFFQFYTTYSIHHPLSADISFIWGLNEECIRPLSPAGPLFWPTMISAVSLFSIAAASAVLTCDLIPSNHQKCRIYSLDVACVI